MHTDGCLPSTWVFLLFRFLALGLWYHLHPVGFEKHKGQKRNNCSGFRDMIRFSLVSDKDSPFEKKKMKINLFKAWPKGTVLILTSVSFCTEVHLKTPISYMPF